MRLEARAEVSRTWQVAAPFAAIAFTLVVCSLLVAWAGVPVGGAYLLLYAMALTSNDAEIAGFGMNQAFIAGLK